MPIATVTSKGQVTIPRAVRDDLKLSTGSRLLFIRLPNNDYRLVPHTADVMELAGVFRDPSEPPLSLADMEEAIAEGAAESASFGLDTRDRSSG
ncbi:MAG: AbrB/MazE/SpoVT family DNA-binding domain-containing protein [Scrofimicrobium sp.]